MIILSIVLGLAAVGAAILGFRDQSSIWWATRAPFFANPEANEPSDIAYGFQRLGLFALAAVLAVGAVMTYRLVDDASWSADEIRSAARQAAQSMADGGYDTLVTPGLTGRGKATGMTNLFRQTVGDRLEDTDEAKGNTGTLSVSPDRSGHAKVDLRHAERAVERYTVSDKGKHPACMTVTGRKGMPLGDPDEKGVPPAYYWKLSGKVAAGACRA